MDTIPQAPVVISTSKHRKFFVMLFVLIVLAVLVYFFYLKKDGIINTQVYTEEQKLKILENLNSKPPADGSTRVTEQQKLDILKNLSNKKPAKADKNAKPLTEAEREALIKSMD